MTSLLLGLRLSRWGIVGFSIAGFALTFIQAVGFYQIAGHSPAERAAFGASMTALSAQFVALFPTPLRPDTVGGYVQFRGFNVLTILFAVWALASSTGFARGDEEHGIVESQLGTGITRPALVASRVGAFAIAVVVASAAAGAGYILGVASGGETVSARGLIEAGALLTAVGLSCYALSLLVAQLAPMRAATALAGALLLALFLVNSLSRVFASLSTWRWLSPFRYYELSQPLPPGGYFDLRGSFVLLVIAAVATAAAAVAFMRRDLGASLIRIPSPPHRPSFSASSMPLWRLPVARGLYEHRLGLVGWSIAMAVLAWVFVALTRTIVQVLLSIPTLVQYLSIFVHHRLYPAVLGYTWFALALTTAVLAALSGLSVAFTSRSANLALDPAHLVDACLLLVLFSVVMGAAGSLLISWVPRAAPALFVGFVLASYLDDQIGGPLGLPGWAQSISAFRLVGTPLLDGVDGRSLALMLALALAGVGSSILVMQRRDVGA
ncbi:MAG: hypothetical protein AUI15_24960 [Actinobacteria bacterium 13_2_20CM_2_66_6]|nr:MAG: hypothetical protein AUI15_24960 [Actinobacteria bacterium 13_2_20CM_2_66_6]